MWLQLVTSIPTENATIRQRVWRALKSAGVGVLRDGVYLLPDRPDCRAAFEQIVEAVHGGSGTTWLLSLPESAPDDFKGLFDRSRDYAALRTDMAALKTSLAAATVGTITEPLKQLRKLRKAFTAVEQIDFFPGAARDQALTTLQQLEHIAARIVSPDEPRMSTGDIPRVKRVEFRQRVWATRQRPWVDRLASAWLIQRFIDPAARFLWLKQPADCPPDAVGFDFDGATFTHVGACVTFEVLLASFGLDESALKRIGAVVHYLDVGGEQPPQAAGIESVLAGLRASHPDDDALLKSSNAIFDALHAAFTQEKTP